MPPVPADTLAGLGDRAILSVGAQVGFRRAEIAALNVGDLHLNRGFDALRVMRAVSVSVSVSIPTSSRATGWRPPECGHSRRRVAAAGAPVAARGPCACGDVVEAVTLNR
jgi:hypothetical protein